MWLEFLLIANVNDTWQEPLKWGKCTKWSRSWCRPNYLVKSACPIQAINVQFEMPFECGRKPSQVQQIWQIWPRGTDMRGPTHNISVSNIARAFSTLKVIGPGCIHILLDTFNVHKYWLIMLFTMWMKTIDVEIWEIKKAPFCNW